MERYAILSNFFDLPPEMFEKIAKAEAFRDTDIIILNGNFSGNSYFRLVNKSNKKTNQKQKNKLRDLYREFLFSYVSSLLEPFLEREKHVVLVPGGTDDITTLEEIVDNFHAEGYDNLYYMGVVSALSFEEDHKLIFVPGNITDHIELSFFKSSYCIMDHTFMTSRVYFSDRGVVVQFINPLDILQFIDKDSISPESHPENVVIVSPTPPLFSFTNAIEETILYKSQYRMPLIDKRETKSQHQEEKYKPTSSTSLGENYTGATLRNEGYLPLTKIIQKLKLSKFISGFFPQNVFRAHDLTGAYVKPDEWAASLFLVASNGDALKASVIELRGAAILYRAIDLSNDIT